MRKQLPPRDVVWLDPLGRPSGIFYDYMQNLEERSAGTPVSVTDPTDGQVLVYNSTTGLFEPKSPSFVELRSTVALPGVSLTTGVDNVWNSLVLPADTGPWMVGCQAGAFGGAGVTITHMHSDFGDGITGIMTSPGAGGTTALHVNTNQSNGWIFPNGLKQFAVSGSNRTINAVVQTDFAGGAGTCVAYGSLYAFRASFT